MQKRIHGVINHNNLPGRVVNIQSRRNIQKNKIRLDKLISSPRPKICCCRFLGGLGDVIMSLPVLKHIKRLLPHCELTYATDLQYSNHGLGDIIDHNPYVDVLISKNDFKEEDYDYSFNITSTGLDREKSGTIPPNRIDMFAEEAGIDVSSDPEPDYIVTEPEREWTRNFIKNNLKILDRNNTNLILISCRSNDVRRTWPYENVDKLADLLVENNPNNIVCLMDWGSSVDRWKDRKNVFALKNLTLPETAALTEQCDLVISPDTSLLHIAGALRKKTVGIFGPIPPETRINYYPNTTAVFVKLNCSFCWYTPSCVDRNKLECLTLITPEMVLEAANKKMKEDYKTLQNITYGKDISKGGQDDLIYVRRLTGGLGDILMCGPALKALKLKYPNKKIHFAIPKQYIDVMKNLDFIDEILDVNTPINKNIYYMIMDLSTPCARYESTRIAMGKRVEKNRVEIFAEALGVRNLLDSYIPYYNVTEEENNWAEEFLNNLNIDNKKKTIGIIVTSAEQYRDYESSKMLTLGEKLVEEYNVLVVGINNPIDVNGIIDICGLKIRESAAIMSKLDGFITVDTGPLHIAAALNIPTIALFGPIDARARCKGYKNVTILQSNQECIPCWRNAHIKCKQNNMLAISKCMDISPNGIVRIAKEKF